MNAQAPSPEAAPRASVAALAAAAVAALLASACCIAPLALVLVGVSGAWIGQLAAFQPYQPIFLLAAALAMAVAWRKIWRAPDCADGRACAVPEARRAQKTMFVFISALLAIVLGFPAVAPLFY